MPNTYVNKVTANGQTLIDLTADTVTPSTLMQGYTAHDKSGALITGTASGSNDFVVTLSYNDQTEMWEPDCTYAEMYAAYTDGKTVVVRTDAGKPASLRITDDPAFLCRYNVFDDYSDASTGTYGFNSLEFRWKANGVYLQGEYPTYDAYDATAVPGDVANGKVFYNSSGRQVGTSSGSTPSLQSKTATPTTSQQVITADSGYDGLSQVTVSAMPSGTAGTPSATKGTVSNHSVSVTPSVTNTTGYITGGTKTGAAVSVSASELVSGSETKTANGTYNVTNLASLVVSIPIVTYHTSSSAPTSSQGSDGDLWLVTA